MEFDTYSYAANEPYLIFLPFPISSAPGQLTVDDILLYFLLSATELGALSPRNGCDVDGGTLSLKKGLVMYG